MIRHEGSLFIHVFMRTRENGVSALRDTSAGKRERRAENFFRYAQSNAGMS